MSGLIETYEEFKVALELRSEDMSPLMWMATRPDRNVMWSSWMLRWLDGQRAERGY